DSTLCSAVLSLLALVVLGFMDRTGDLVGANKTGQLVVVSATFLLTLVYFAFCESRWGRGVGKWLMGLRVVNERGQAPGFGMAFLRAAIAPGLANLVRSFLPLLYAWNSNSAAGVTADTGNLVVVSVGFPLLSLAVGLIVLSSMRRTNGFRGLHDFATRTRVVRLHAKAARKTAPAVMVPIKESVSAGPQYDVAGSLAKTDSYAVYAATDKMLARPVWLMASDANEAPLSAERVGVARGTRQHVLRHHVQDGQRWDALEAVSGVPVAEIDFEKEAYSWTAIREALIDLGEELHTASKDGTLPAEMTLQQVWIDSAGRVKLLDRPVGGSTSEMATKVLNPKQLLCAVLERCRLMLPGEGLDLLHALRSKPDSPETLEWAIEQLSQLGHRPGRMTWDERLGAIAISFGIELTFVQTMSLVMAIVIHMLQPQVLIAVAIAVALPLIVGFAFRGGPVFRLAGLEVRRHGRPASAVRCAIRNLVAWVPITVGSALLMWFVGEMFHAEGQQTSAGTRAAFFGITLVGMTIGLLGAVAAVLMPRRGVQDIVAGTELVVR
ncbi:MAG: RDD family protein, partial [Planctomycetaceae bacterium]